MLFTPSSFAENAVLYSKLFISWLWYRGGIRVKVKLFGQVVQVVRQGPSHVRCSTWAQIMGRVEFCICLNYSHSARHFLYWSVIALLVSKLVVQPPLVCASEDDETEREYTRKALN